MNAGSAPQLRADRLSLAYDGKTVIDTLDLDVPPGQITSIIGPNGCGKSTLLKGLGRLLPAHGGAVLLDGVPLAKQSTRHVATRLSVLPQTPTAPAGLTVGELVSRGRHPRQKWYQQFGAVDERMVREAMEATDIAELAAVPVEDLSGGQRQRAWISMTLAQETEILLLDEPTTYLDLAHQVDVLGLIHRLNTELGRTVLMVLHDISLAARYSDNMIAMKAGKIVAQGTPSEVVTEQTLFDVFGLRAQIIAEPVLGRPHVIPLAA